MLLDILLKIRHQHVLAQRGGSADLDMSVIGILDHAELLLALFYKFESVLQM